MKKRDWGFIAVAGTVIGVLAALSLVGKKPVPMSDGAYHAGLTVHTKRAECMACHDPGTPGAQSPLPDTHPLVWKKEGVACVTCHTPPPASPRPSGQARALRPRRGVAP